MNNKNKPMEFFKTKCRENKLRITPQRVAIYQELINDRTHPSADDVYKRIRIKFSNISFDTVNRTLLSFADAGIIKIAENYGRQKIFDPNVDSHHHLSCIKCYKIIDFNNKEYDHLEIPSSIRNKYRILSKRVVLECICENCSKKKQ